MSTQTASKHLLDIPKFDGTGWETWSFQLENVLAEFNYWGLVTGTDAKPTEKDAITKWEERDAAARRRINLLCGTQVIHHVRNCTTSREAFDALKSAYAMEGCITAWHLRKQMIYTKFDDSRLLRAQVDKMHQMRVRIQETGWQISDLDYAITISEAFCKV